MQALWEQAWVSVTCALEAAKRVQTRECSYSKWLFLMLLLATAVFWSLCLQYGSLRLASLLFLYSAVSSTSLFFVSSVSCLSVLLFLLFTFPFASSVSCLLAFFFTSSVSHLSFLLFLLIVFPFALPAIALGLTVVVGHSYTTHYMGITRTHSGSDVVVVVYP